MVKIDKTDYKIIAAVFFILALFNIGTGLGLLFMLGFYLTCRQLKNTKRRN